MFSNSQLRKCMIHIICSRVEWIVGVELEISSKYERLCTEFLIGQVTHSEIVLKDQ